MRFQRFAKRYIVRLESGRHLAASITALLAHEEVAFASLTAAGAVRSVRLGYWDATSCRYEYRDVAEQLEVVSFEGSAALKDGEPFLHLHGAFSRRDFSVGGHIKDAVVHPTMEVWLRGGLDAPDS
ncbi:MAG: PPC domain-containing DNA-binding protein [Dehalococcoidia bacterium]